MNTIAPQIEWWLVEEVEPTAFFDGWIDARNNLISHLFRSRARSSFESQDEKRIFVRFEPWMSQFFIFSARNRAPALLFFEITEIIIRKFILKFHCVDW